MDEGENPHTQAWLQDDYVCLDEQAWTAERLRMRAIRFRRMWTTVVQPALDAAEALENEQDKELALKAVSGIMSQLQLNLQSFYN